MAVPTTGSEDLTRSLELVLEPSGWTLLESLPPYDETDALRLGAKLREDGHASELVASVLTQSRLRAEAREKFGEFASRMLLTPAGLEQATRLPIAALHARRFQQAGARSVADLGCGIGGDAMALAGLGLDVHAVDRDPAAVAVATVNLRPFPNATVTLGAAEDHDPAATDAIWLDPARRAPAPGSARGTQRLHDPQQYEPPLSAVTELARRLGSSGKQGLGGAADTSTRAGTDHGYGPVGAKLGPGIDHAALPPGTETQWLSWHGQVLEACCWFGPLAAPDAARTALVIGGDGAHRLTPGPDAPGDPEPGPPGAHLYEPDGAVIRAGLIGRLAADLDAHTLDATIAYLTSDTHRATPFARGYRIDEVMPFSVKRLTTYLREHHLGVLEIKKRGTAVEPEQLRRKLRPRRFGDGRATVILTRIGGEQHALVTTPHRELDA